MGDHTPITLTVTRIFITKSDENLRMCMISYSKFPPKLMCACTLFSVKKGQCTTDTFAPSHRGHATRSAGCVGEQAEGKKAEKYAHLAPAYLFQPVAIETSGAIGSRSRAFLFWGSFAYLSMYVDAVYSYHSTDLIFVQGLQPKHSP